jgi:uncharacterized protein (TIGR02996 family)
MRETFETKILENRDDVDSYLVYSDWLMDQGDPLGEFIRVQIQLEDESLDSKQRQQLQEKESRLIMENQQHWLPEIQPLLVQEDYETKVEVKYERGFVTVLTCSRLNIEKARAIAREPASRWIQELTIYGTEWDEDFEPGDDAPDDIDRPCLYPLAKSQYLTGLRELSVVDAFDWDAENWGVEQTGDGVAELVENSPELTTLWIGCYQADFDRIFAGKTPQLREIRLSGSYDYDLPILAANENMSNLRSLIVHPDAPEQDHPPPLAQTICRPSPTRTTSIN